MSGISIGIFVGGRGRRMGGVAKGLLRAPDSAETLIDRLLRVCSTALPDARLYLVGRSTSYAALPQPRLVDDPAGTGPIGGLRSLITRAIADRSALALALACDLPFIDEAVLSTLSAPLAGTARVPLCEARLQPLAAAYAPLPTLGAIDQALTEGEHALMRVLERLGAGLERVEFDAERALSLRDWDTPEDVERH